MTVIISLVKRNLKMFFRDKTSVFFSLLSVFIIIGLYILFLGNLISGSLKDLLGESARFTTDSWIMAGLLSVTSITTTMGAFGTMVEDNSKKIIKDFSSAPLKRSQLVGGYIISSFVIGMVMSIAALIVAEIYIFSGGGKFLELLPILKLIGLMMLSVFTSSAMVFFIVLFFKSINAFATASTIVGTLIGFLTGIYIPIGNLPATMQTVIKIFPISYSGSLFRQIMMDVPMAAGFKNVPAEVISSFKQTMGVVYYFNGKEISPLVSILILVATGILFYALAVIKMSIKKK
ncbi:MAG: ABC transporter permease [Candidatus Humimicrobiaceae bacterium]